MTWVQPIFDLYRIIFCITTCFSDQRYCKLNGSRSNAGRIGMISRGEVGLIVAGVDVSSGALSNDIYATVVIMVAVTMIITPIWLKFAYRKEPTEHTSLAKTDNPQEQ
jgi:Kef-type K+ transport system membrane component KefB